METHRAAEQIGKLIGEGDLGQGHTIYDRVLYPSALYRTTHPEHLAAILRLHGLDGADPRRARVLEIAGGDGLNAMAMAAAYPDAQFVSFDLAPSAVAQGQAMADAAGLSNARIMVGDIVDLADRLEGPFDYVIAHGLYAWVSPEVQQATLRLIDRVLAPEGIAYISYNAMPGGHLRMAVRQMLLRRLEGITEPEERLKQALDFLKDFGRPKDDDGASQAALRRIARLIVEKNAHTLFHDELGEWYDPKSLTQICAEAGAHHLAYLTEAQPGGLFHGLPGRDLDDAQVVRLAQQVDDDDVCFFHQSLFIRPGRAPLRRLDVDALARLLICASPGLEREGELAFAIGGNRFETDDADLAKFLDLLVRERPLRVPLAHFATDEARGLAILNLVNRGILELHSLPFPGVLNAGPRPQTTSLTRALIAGDQKQVLTLDHRSLTVVEEAPRQVLALLDGSLTLEEVCDRWDRDVKGPDMRIDAVSAITQLARAGLLCA